MIKWISALLLLSNCTLFLSSFALKGAKEESVSNCVTFSSRVDPEDCYFGCSHFFINLVRRIIYNE